jgi:hypothetical protein
MKSAIMLSICLLLATHAQAQIYTGSGQIVITQANASGSGIGPGDSPGYPVTITNPGSYKLGSNLLPPSGVDAVDISADFVTLDLNGYTIKGGETCSIVPPNIYATCTAGSFGAGVYSTAMLTTVKGGAINGFTAGVVFLGDGGSALNLSFSQNATGLENQTNAVANTIEDVQVFNGGDGITMGAIGTQLNRVFIGFNGALYGALLSLSGSDIISNVTLKSNSPDGLYLLNGGVIHDVTSTSNIGIGIHTLGSPTVIASSTATLNGADGFSTSGGGPAKNLLINLNSVGNVNDGYQLIAASCYFHLAGEGNATNLVSGTPLTALSTTCF